MELLRMQINDDPFVRRPCSDVFSGNQIYMHCVHTGVGINVDWTFAVALPCSKSPQHGGWAKPLGYISRVLKEEIRGNFGNPWSNLKPEFSQILSHKTDNYTFSLTIPCA